MSQKQNGGTVTPILLKSGAPAHILTAEDRAKALAKRRERKAEAEAKRIADLAGPAYELLGLTLKEGIDAARNKSGQVNGTHMRAVEAVVDRLEPKQQGLTVAVNPLEMDAGAFLAHVEGMLRRRQLEDGNTVEGEAQELPSDDPGTV